MSLTPEQFERAATFEAHQQRLVQLQRMSYRELQKLLTGDPAEAALWVRSAAEYGMPAAQLRLGRMLLEGNGVERDERAAFIWFDRAANRGDAEAMNMAGRCHENGWGVPTDMWKAAEAVSGVRGRRPRLGRVQLRQHAVRRTRRAPRQGGSVAVVSAGLESRHGRAMNLAARCFEEGWGCAKSPAEAAEWYRRSAQTGYFRAQFNYGVLLAELGEGRLPQSGSRRPFRREMRGSGRLFCGRLRGTTDPALVGLRERLP